MTQIAREVGVSVAVVSRFLRRDPNLRISSQRQKEILQAKERLGGVKIRPTKRRLTRTILVPIRRPYSSPDWMYANVFGTETMRSLETVLREQNFRLHYTVFDSETQHKTFETLIKSHTECDGLIFLSGGIDDATANLLRRCVFPHVSLDIRAETYGVNTVTAHMTDAMQQVVEHLYQLGHRNIAYLGPRKGIRYPMIISTLIARQLSIREDLYCWIPQVKHPNEGDSLWTTQACEKFGAVLDQGTEATAFICHNDLIALGALKAMKERGVIAGRDISIVGYDNIEEANPESSETPILTTVERHTDMIGQKAAEHLLAQILHGQREIIHIRIPTTLIVRETTGPCPSPAR